MEAIRESIEDFETLLMLRKAVEKAKQAGKSSDAVKAAETLLDEGVSGVLDAKDANKLSISNEKDRTKADAIFESKH